MGTRTLVTERQAAPANPTPRRPDLIQVRATINLAGLPHGHTAHVSPADPYIADLLAARYLVPV